MPVLSFTADATTDQLTATAHGLLTGDGPMLVMAAAFPGGLAIDVPYWAIRVDADHIKLATSNSNAVAGTEINITSNGTGPMTLRVGLPDIEDLTYVGGSQISSKNLMNMQRIIVAAYRLLTGQVQSIWDGIVLAANQHVTVSGTGRFKHGADQLIVPASAANAPTGSGAVLAVGSFLWTCAANDKVAFPIVLAPGKRITSVDVWYQRGSGTLNFDLKRATLSTGAVTLIANASVSTGTTLTSVTLGSLNHTVLGTDQYILEFTAGGADTVRGLIVNFDAP